VLLYSIAGIGEDHLLKFAKTTSYMGMSVLKLDKTTTLFSANSATNFSITAVTVAALYFTYGNNQGLCLTGSNNSKGWVTSYKCGAEYKVLVYGNMLLPGSDTYFGTASDVIATPMLPTMSGKQVLVPAFLHGDSPLNITESPVEDLYAFLNKDGVAAWAQVAVGSNTYLVSPTSSRHLVKVG
jgi:hypothetical protein